MGIDILSYGLTVIAFAVLAVLMAVSFRGNALAGRLLACCVAMSVWALAVIVAARATAITLEMLLVVEAVRNVVLLWAVFAIGRQVLPRWLPKASYAAIAAGTIFGLANSWLPESSRVVIDVAANPQWLARTALLCACIGLVSLEQIYRNASTLQRWSLRFLMFGFGIVFAYDLFLYSQFELFRAFPLDAWTARGAVMAIAVPMLAIGIRRHPEGMPTLFVSRQVVFYTGAFLAMGLYLIVVAGGGYYVRLVGGNWGSFAQILLLSGSLT